MKLQRNPGVAKEIFLRALAPKIEPFSRMKPGNLIRIHRHDEYGAEERKRFQPCFVGSLNQDGLLESLGSFGPAIVNRCKGAQGLKLLVSLGEDPD